MAGAHRCIVSREKVLQSQFSSAEFPGDCSARGTQFDFDFDLLEHARSIRRAARADARRRVLFLLRHSCIRHSCGCQADAAGMRAVTDSRSNSFVSRWRPDAVLHEHQMECSRPRNAAAPPKKPLGSGGLGMSACPLTGKRFHLSSSMPPSPRIHETSFWGPMRRIRDRRKER